MIETVLIWVLGAIGAYFAFSFIWVILVAGFGLYFVWKMTK